jgi:filamentous hemagglutinin family protein
MTGRYFDIPEGMMITTVHGIVTSSKPKARVFLITPSGTIINRRGV